MPFPRSPDFVGRTDDLGSLHAALRTRESVGIRPAGLTGMGGIGKTQLAVEYVYRHRGDYPGGIFWVNAAQPLAQGLAQLGGWLRPDILDQSPDRQLRATFEELSRRSDALLVFDNLGDPARLTLPVGSEPSPLTLGCRILFTTRQRDLGRFHPVEVSVLPEEPALQLLLRHESRHPVHDDLSHPERREAQAICRLLGWLPLALELASAFLAEWPDMPLADYRKRLEKKGCLSTLDSEARNLAGVNFQPIHAAAVAVTLQTQWETLKPDGDEAARLVFRTAGQFTEAATIPTAALGLFAGVPDIGEPGDPSPLRRALKRLHSVRLVEELLERHVRLHPLVREFSAGLTPLSETPGFRHDCARRVARAFENFANLEDTTRTDGVDGVQQTLTTVLDFIAGGEDEPAETLHAMLRVVRRESHRLREWDAGRQPNYFAQQVLFRAATLGETALADRAEHRLEELGRPALLARWRTLHESPALVRILAGHERAVWSVAVSPDGRHAVTGSEDGTAVVWDLATGRQLCKFAGHWGEVCSVVSLDGRHAVTGSGNHTAVVWDLATGQRLRELAGHGDWVTSVAVSPDGRHAVTGSEDGTAVVWDLATGQRLRELAGHRGEVRSVAMSPDGRHAVTGSEDGTAIVWDLATGRRLREARRPV